MSTMDEHDTASVDVARGSSASDVGVCTLWTPRDRILAALDPADYAIAGNLYSLGGISLLLRTLLANPSIRHLVVCGADATGTGRALVRLFREGPGPDGAIPGTRSRLDPAIPPDAVERLRAAVDLVDLRGTTDPDRVAAAVRALPHLPPWGEPVSLAPAAAPFQSISLPSEVVALRFEARDAAAAWLDLLAALLDFGRPVGDRHLLLAPVAVLLGPEPPTPPDWLPGRADRPPALPSPDQPPWSQLVAALAAHGLARHAWPPGSSAPLPDLDALQLGRLDDALWLTAQLAPLGAFAWPHRASDVRRLHERLATAAGLALGPTALVTAAVDLGSADRPAAAALVAARRPATMPFRSDPRGCFLVRLEGKEIVAEHEVEGLGRSGRVFRGRQAAPIYRAMLQAGLVGRLDHAAYLGAELARAELALRLGLSYRQDESP